MKQQSGFFKKCIDIFAPLFKHQPKKLEQGDTGEIQRLFSYVCSEHDHVMEINLHTNLLKEYVMRDGTLHIDEKYYSPAKPVREYMHPEDFEQLVKKLSKAEFRKIIREGKEYVFEARGKAADGTYKWYIYSVYGIVPDKIHPCNFMVFKRNIDDLKKKEEEGKKALLDALEVAREASDAKGTFMSRMSHEIRTPLNAIIGYMEIARESGENPSKMMHCVENSQIAAKHLLSIINDVLDISAIESGKMKIDHSEFDLKSQITSISTLFFNQTKKKGIHFEVILNDITEEWVIGDSLRLNQILMNLLSNAVKFTPEGGLITLSMSQVCLEEKSVYMKFTVKDTGIGMSEEYKARLFQPFEQESAGTAQKYGGTGLGLSITSNLVYMMGGSIDVESRQGEGTTFVVSLHFERSFKEHENTCLHQDYSHVRVLIVDDDEAACEYMKGLLKRCRIKSDVVKDGASAIQQIKRRIGSDYAYDMCIIDWNMPDMNGMETARRIKEECNPDMPVIIATAYDITEFEDEAKEIGVEKIIAKPLFQSTMFDLLVTLYGKYEPEETQKKNLESMKGLRVLLAEDNQMNMEIAVEILQKAGLIVDAVTDGKQALYRFVGSPTGSYDAILMDVQMPVMDGYQATGAIRRSAHPEAKSIPIIAMTANAFTEDVNAALASGMDGHISKPVDYDKLYEALNRLVVNKKSEID